MKFKERFKKYWKTLLITFIISLLVGVGLFFTMFFTGGRALKASTDGAALAAAVLLCSAGLVWVTRLGAFDTFAFGFKQLGHMMFTREKPNEYNSMREYNDKKMVKRASSPDFYLPILAAGTLFLIATIVLAIIFEIRY